MACERVGEAVTCVPPSDGNTVWWDTGGSALWIWNFGSAAEWVTAIVAIIAVGAAWKASTRSHQLQADLNRVEQGREDRADRDRERREMAEKRGLQADAVAAWKTPNPYPPNSPDGRAFTRAAHVVIRNGSPLPIFFVRIVIFNWAGDEVRLYHGVDDLPPGDHDLVVPNVPYGTMDVKGSDGKIQTIREDWGHLKVGLRFMDTAGRIWIRDAYGTLSLEEEPDDPSTEA